MGNTPPRRPSLTRTRRERESELDKFTNPTGLYPSCPWDVRVARKMILDKKIAPRFPGRDSKESCFTQECPICFMFYPGNLNVATCCNQSICTECFLQLKHPKKPATCPFCNREGFEIKYAAPAVINLSTIHAETSYTMSTSNSASPNEAEASMALHFASVEERQNLRADLRTQLNLTDQRLTTPVERPPVSRNRPSMSARYVIASAEDAARLAEPRVIIASAADAARLEEMMMMEAIRRSMRDVRMTKDDSEGSSDDSGETDSLRPSQITLETAQARTRVVSRRPSSNPFDDEMATPERRQSASGHWNPFHE